MEEDAEWEEFFQGAVEPVVRRRSNWALSCWEILRRSLRRARASFLSFELAERGPDPHSLPSFFQLKLGGIDGEKVAGEEKMIGEVWGLFEGFEELADDFVLELVALDFQLG